MSITMYQMSVPVIVHGLRSLGAFLEKGRADAVARGFEPAVLIEGRLAPDMHKLTKQVQIASDIVKNGVARLAGIAPPAFPDTETTFEELQTRVANTIAFVDGVTAAQMEGCETRTIELKFPGREMTFTGVNYLTGFVLPNLYFHMTTAYNILRHNGVKLGKADFMGVS